MVPPTCRSGSCGEPVVTTPEEIAGVLREADAAPDCVGVVAWMHTFSPAKMWIAGLTDLRKPLVHLHTQYNRDLPWAEIDMEFMNLHQSAHGDREFAFIQTRLRRGRKTVVGHWQDPVVARRLGAWSRAAAGWHEAHRLRIARFGDNMREVAVTEGDKVEAQARLGFSVNGYGVSDLVRRVEAVSDADVDSLVATYEASYDVVPDLRRAGSRHAELRTAARIEAGLRCFLEEGDFGGFTDTFEDLSDLKQLPGIGVQRLMADGYGFGAEGDWKAAALVRILKVMASGLPGGTSFMEDYTYHLGDPVPEVLGAHMLEVCPSIAAGRPVVRDPSPVDRRHARTRSGSCSTPRPVLRGWSGWPTWAIASGCSSASSTWSSRIGRCGRLPVARAVWRPRPDLATATEAWLMAGGPHHTALTSALGIEALTDFADIADVELLVIDEGTSVTAFKHELRWNQAYHFLKRGM